MAFEGSYLWRLRQRVGSELVLMPGAMTALVREDGAVLLVHRTDEDSWCLPAGGAEEGQGFAETALAELREEAGVEVDPADLVGFGCLSGPEDHTITYPNGDVTHCFAMCFLAHRWRGEARADGEESDAVGFFALDELPERVHAPSAVGLEMLGRYLGSGEFQVR